jgi:hypothetical protein
MIAHWRKHLRVQGVLPPSAFAPPSPRRPPSRHSSCPRKGQKASRSEAQIGRLISIQSFFSIPNGSAFYLDEAKRCSIASKAGITART